MNKKDKKLQKHLVDEMMKVYETNPNVMIYMQSLMENYEKLEQENKQLKERIDKAIEYIKEHNVIATNKEYLPKDYEYCCSYELLEILGGKE